MQPLTPLMISGACEGADTFFGMEAKRSGHEVIHVLGPHNRASDEVASLMADTLLQVTDELLDGPLVSPAFEKACEARSLGDSSTWRLSRRNYLQVRGASAVFAVCYRLPPSPTTPKLDIGGGTGLACQMYVDRFVPRGPEDASRCLLYMYDDGAPTWDGCLKDERTWRHWNMWDPIAAEWKPLAVAPALPSGPDLYAGIGATRLDADHGVAAIRALYQ